MAPGLSFVNTLHRDQEHLLEENIRNNRGPICEDHMSRERVGYGSRFVRRGGF